MEEIMAFFANHVVLFSILGFVSLFGLVGFFVDQSEQKKGISKINPTIGERDIHELANKAEQKTLNNAITDAAKKSNSMSNTITDTVTNQESATPAGFNAINK